SPEYVALAWGKQHSATVAFIDISVGQALATHQREIEDEAPEADSDDDDLAFSRDSEEDETAEGSSAERAPAEAAVDIHTACAEARGFRSFEEFWEASFEAPSYDADAFRSALLAYAELVRLSQDQPFHRIRDAFMVTQILARLEKDPGLTPEQIVVVVGAA